MHYTPITAKNSLCMQCLEPHVEDYEHCIVKVCHGLTEHLHVKYLHPTLLSVARLSPPRELWGKESVTEHGIVSKTR